MVMECWRRTWRRGVAPLLSVPGLTALRLALEGDDERLIQGATTSPPPLHCVLDWELDGACAVTYAGWQGDRLKTVGEAEDYFALVCREADKRLGEDSAVRLFLNFFDETPRDQMRRMLLPEVERELKRRQGKEAVQTA